MYDITNLDRTLLLEYHVMQFRPKSVPLAIAPYNHRVQRPGRPDLIELQIAWSRKILDAQLLLHPTGPDRRKALEAHRDRVAALAAKTHLLKDATNAAIAQVDHAVAEAEFLLSAKEQN
jgi:hypothetical protein